ncbi:MAG: molybdenum cofactor guanylyltransferase MobA [Pseudomonadota bacterium]
MHHIQAKFTGVALAGGLSRRMGGGDKGLILFNGRPLIHYVLQALTSVSGKVVINANRNQDVYRKMGYRVISDQTETFDGPLAGILSVMRSVDTPYIITAPCDSPLITGEQLLRLVGKLQASRAEVCAAHDGERLHPVFLALKSQLADSLEHYLRSGQRKIDTWLYQHTLVLADCSDQPDMFRNINTPEELAGLEAAYRG